MRRLISAAIMAAIAAWSRPLPRGGKMSGVGGGMEGLAGGPWIPIG